ncbi:RNA polymerase sigma factor [Fulvivirga sp. M361]|uniref:RNA polymerase sigma factor n=1 Tax=Fulvivirga sp. M361 TaxID=2594266 RepID=UPI001629C8CF|nr:RNA polymerase sigma-70 factor [Fulvivirga sp. M361]
MTTDQNIVIRNLKKGDEACFCAVFNEYYGPLVRFANSYLLDHTEAEDVVQSTFIRIWEKADRLKINLSLDAYLFASVKNSCLNRLKKIRVRDQNDLLFIEGLINYYTESNRIDLNLEEQLREAIQKLPRQVREIIQLKYSQNKKISEISEILNISENTIKTQLQRGKSKLKMEMRISNKALTLLLILNIPF